MRLTTESARARWLILLVTWLVAAVLIVSHQSAQQDYVAMLNGLGERPGAGMRTPLRQVVPARYADAHMWVRHALAANETGAARVRFTHADNAPHGREVHWSSAFAWLVRGADAVQRARTGESTPFATERALRWFNVPLLLVVIVLLSRWAAARAGAGAGVIVALAMVGHKRLYEGFAPLYVDHHGLVTASVLGMLLGLVFMGGGWSRPAVNVAAEVTRPLPVPASAAGRTAAIVSALCGAFAMWLSAAAVLPVIAIAGVMGLALTWWAAPPARRGTAIFEPAWWRLWGRVGAAASLAFYLVEYAPSHLGMRLEVNHPLYAAAWWGGAEIVATLGAWRAEGGGTIGRMAPRLLLPGIALLAAPFALWFGGTAVFLVSDPFVGALRHFVAEGMTLPKMIREFGLGAVGYELGSTLVLVAAGIVLFRQHDESRLVLAFATAVCAALVLMAVFEMRWWLNAAAAQIALVLVLLATVTGAAAKRWAWIIGVAVVLLVVPAVHRVATARAENRALRVAAGDLLEPLYRDIAAALRDTQPEGEIVVLASPNASAGIGYYGRFKTLGTLYWENAPGLRAAAEIFSAASDEEALRLARARGVTHVVMLPTANFLGEYFSLLHPTRDPTEARKAFGYRLLAGESLPPWLQPIPYRPPPDLKDATPSVALFKVVASQARHEQLYHAAVAQVAAGDIARAEKTLAQALAEAPADARLPLCEAAGIAFYDFGADAAAIRVFRRGLEFGDAPMLVNTLAWILATSSDTAARDGRAALALIEPRARAEPNDPTVLSTLAAAYAEAGRFADAVRAAERAVAFVRAAGDREAATLLQRRLETYRAGKPWRQ